MLKKTVLIVEHIIAFCAMQLAPSNTFSMIQFYVTFHPLLLVRWQTTNHAIEQLNSQAILSPPSNAIQGFLIKKMQTGIEGVAGAIISVVAVAVE